MCFSRTDVFLSTIGNICLCISIYNEICVFSSNLEKPKVMIVFGLPKSGTGYFIECVAKVNNLFLLSEQYPIWKINLFYIEDDFQCTLEDILSMRVRCFSFPSIGCLLRNLSLTSYMLKLCYELFRMQLLLLLF